MLDDIEDVLLRADLGTEVAAAIADAVGQGRYDKAISADDVKAVVATEVEKVLRRWQSRCRSTGAKAVRHSGGRRQRLRQDDHHRQARGETQRRGPQGDAGGRRHVSRRRHRAVEGLGRAHQSPVIAGAQGSDSASLAFNALTAAKEQKIDVLLIDTAGRLQNKAELMNELEKVVRVIKKVDASAPHAVLLVLDATVGQNALSQVEAFIVSLGLPAS